MTSVKEKIYTIDAIYALPDGERAELIDGRIYMMAPPNTMHQNLVSEFTITIGNYIRSKGGNCKVFPAPFAVFLNNDNQNYVEPDISVICDKNKLDDRGCHGAPDWVIEVVSPQLPKDGLRDQALQISHSQCPGVLDRQSYDLCCERI